MERKEFIRFHFDVMALNDQLMQWYRAFFLAFEAAMLGGVLAIRASPEIPSWWAFILVILGLVLSFAGLWACVQRQNIVDRQKMKIISELYDKQTGKPKDPKDSLADCFQIYNKYDLKIVDEWEKKVPRNSFNIWLHVIIGASLLGMLWEWKPFPPDWWLVTYGVITVIYVGGMLYAYFRLSRLGIPEDLWEEKNEWEKIKKKRKEKGD